MTHPLLFVAQFQKQAEAKQPLVSFIDRCTAGSVYHVTDRTGGLVGVTPKMKIEVRTDERIWPLRLALMTNNQTRDSSIILFLGRGLYDLDNGTREPIVVVAQTNPLITYIVPERLIEAIHPASVIGLPDIAYVDAIEPLMTSDYIGDPIPAINPGWRPWLNLKGSSDAVH